MERFKLGVRSPAQNSISDNSSSNYYEPPLDQTRVLVRAGSRNVVSLWTCSKLCAISFAVGVFIGFTLRRRLRAWASKALKRIKDD
ncbi:uncharacterized protein LOC110022932 [Phalaenopsis equestris]|uniref:uncharacterized protein LOC110022932 n=1 Tax=Phalaenopsis equestris TaxID=78828 RepID=UPI0009E52671|nr:uncharacterized protein LOC110022932 [Phalaenopsis equestris]